MAHSLAGIIREHTTRSLLPNGNEGNTIDIYSIAQIAHSFKCPGYVVEAEAIRNAVYPSRYLRNMESISDVDQIELLESSVALVGLGGLGGHLLEMFLRTGIGRIRAADGDVFEESNLNRQALSSINTSGIPKADVAVGRTHTINPSIEVDAIHGFLDTASLPEFLSGQDIAVDALGGLTTRLDLQHAAAKANIPLVTGALAGWTGYVSVVMPGQTGPADIMGQDNAAEEKLGCPAPAVTFMASLMAIEVVKILTESTATLAGKILIIDLKSLTFDTISI